MSGLLLRLAAPLQSWGEHSAFARRDTQPFPTRSGLVGMFAAAHGIERSDEAGLARFEQLRFTIRVDRPGIQLRDFHTVGGGLAARHTVVTARGGRRAAGKGTIVTHRYYLSDAEFTVAVEGPDALLSELADAINRPRWQLYLGRRSCPPEQPLLIGRSETPLEDLLTRVPIHARHRSGIDVITDGQSGTGPCTEVADVPVSFDPLRRRHHSRVVVTSHREAPRRMWRPRAADYQDALFAYMGVS
ncbi:type I-E CRISPR-associated protein Cas5/CasD [Nocardia neocaledoniensis NBRC 108232]|uniref:CRISPR-associated Cas5e family protein n=1 Tax=Nocardia neocaledoniensis TaxID=236511 RepID=A0A317NLI7_9NOCA|nr:type I-E CRISPR-associated protein Cas5/CasD [Nocardia neocaledoniensis]PWV74508.1 CRISPR-associated Cas5e family protein [Nocardia neocaledoniensis]GEM33149.1 type I-E CRISPR-associated protein Cas5/CasD [Nocardia neocaledoniensis NBRC 108232]